MKTIFDIGKIEFQFSILFSFCCLITFLSLALSIYIVSYLSRTIVKIKSLAYFLFTMMNKKRSLDKVSKMKRTWFLNKNNKYSSYFYITDTCSYNYSYATGSDSSRSFSPLTNLLAYSFVSWTFRREIFTKY